MDQDAGGPMNAIASVTLSDCVNPLLVAAKTYAERGWRVFPLHEAPNGVCSCRQASACQSAGKHPRTRHGVKEATTYFQTIEGWWSKWPSANVGVATGSGLVVVDVD